MTEQRRQHEQRRRRKADNQNFVTRNLSSILVFITAVVSVTGIYSKAGAFDERLDAFADLVDKVTVQVDANTAAAQAQERRTAKLEEHIADLRTEVRDLAEIRPDIIRAIERVLEEARALSGSEP